MIPPSSSAASHKCTIVHRRRVAFSLHSVAAREPQWIQAARTPTAICQHHRPHLTIVIPACKASSMVIDATHV